MISTTKIFIQLCLIKNFKKISYEFSGPMRQITEPGKHDPSDVGSLSVTNGGSSSVTTLK